MAVGQTDCISDLIEYGGKI